MYTKIKSQYDGKCSKCGHELKSGWDIFYDKDNPDKTKRVLCINCGKTAGGVDSTSTAGLIKTLGFSGVCSNCGNPIEREDEVYHDQNGQWFCSTCGVIASTPKADFALISAKLENKFDEIAGSNRLIAELLGSLADKLNNIEHNLSMLYAKSIEKKEKPAKVEAETKG